MGYIALLPCWALVEIREDLHKQEGVKVRPHQQRLRFGVQPDHLIDPDRVGHCPLLIVDYPLLLFLTVT